MQSYVSSGASLIRMPKSFQRIVSSTRGRGNEDKNGRRDIKLTQTKLDRYRASRSFRAIKIEFHGRELLPQQTYE